MYLQHMQKMKVQMESMTKTEYPPKMKVDSGSLKSSLSNQQLAYQSMQLQQ